MRLLSSPSVGSPFASQEACQMRSGMGASDRSRRGSGSPSHGPREREMFPLLQRSGTHLLSGREHPQQGALYNKEAWMEAVKVAFGDVNLPRMPLLWSTIITFVVVSLELIRRSGSLPPWVPSFSMPADAHSFVGPPLGFLLVFRLSNAYERWSEGRQFFGKITANLRLLAGQFGLALGGKDEEKLQNVTNLLKAFIYSTRDFLRNHSAERMAERVQRLSFSGRNSDTDRGLADKPLDLLRGAAGIRGINSRQDSGTNLGLSPSQKKDEAETPDSDSWHEVFCPEDAFAVASAHHAPLQVAEMIRREALEAGRRGLMTEGCMEACQEYIAELVRGITGCERILTTRMPYAFVMHLRAVLLIFLCTLPPVILGSLGPLLALPAQLAVSYAMLGTEAAAVNCEEPFGYDLNDLPMNRLCAEVARDLDEIVCGCNRRAAWQVPYEEPH